MLALVRKNQKNLKCKSFLLKSQFFLRPARELKNKEEQLRTFPIASSSKFPTEESVAAEKYNFAPKFPQNWFSAPHSAFWDQKFGIRRQLSNIPKFCGWTGSTGPYACHDVRCHLSRAVSVVTELGNVVVQVQRVGIHVGTTHFHILSIQYLLHCNLNLLAWVRVLQCINRQTDDIVESELIK